MGWPPNIVDKSTFCWNIMIERILGVFGLFIFHPLKVQNCLLKLLNVSSWDIVMNTKGFYAIWSRGSAFTYLSRCHLCWTHSFQFSKNYLQSLSQVFYLPQFSNHSSPSLTKVYVWWSKLPPTIEPAHDPSSLLAPLFLLKLMILLLH